ncbi:hypothetical protein Dimus_017640 [Dionaea muscipula]
MKRQTTHLRGEVTAFYTGKPTCHVLNQDLRVHCMGTNTHFQLTQNRNSHPPSALSSSLYENPRDPPPPCLIIHLNFRRKNYQESVVMVRKKVLPFCLSLSVLVLFVLQNSLSEAAATATAADDSSSSSYAWGTVGGLVKREERRVLLSTETGKISSVDVRDGIGRQYHLQFIRLDPNSLLLPLLLHADMVFYVHTGTGRLSWTNDDKISRMPLERGDLFRLEAGTIFYLQSGLQHEKLERSERLRINAIFTNSNEDLQQVSSVGAYSSINDLIRGFDKRILQAAFKVPEEVIEELVSGAKTPAIVPVPAVSTRKKNLWEKEALLVKAVLGMGYSGSVDRNKKKLKAFNFFKEDPDLENCNGWSTAVTQKHLNVLRGSNIGAFMVNLSRGGMMGPHWNPMATEMSVVLQGQGMVRVVCPSTATDQECKSSRFRVKEGDVFTVPRFHAMAQIAFNNESLVFMGFSTTTKENHPQFLAGKASVLRVLDKHVLGASLNVANTTLDQILTAQAESVILDCASCAEEEEMLLEKEIEREIEEEEEARRQQEEKKREKESRRKEEEKRRQEEKEEEEEKRRQEEERRRQEEEEERRRQEEEEERRSHEKEEEEEEGWSEEEERRQHEEGAEEEEEAAQREEEDVEEEMEQAAAVQEREKMEQQRKGERKSKWEREKKPKEQGKSAEEEREGELHTTKGRILLKRKYGSLTVHLDHCASLEGVDPVRSAWRLQLQNASNPSLPRGSMTMQPLKVHHRRGKVADKERDPNKERAIRGED